MDLVLQKISAIMIIGGAIIFFIGAAHPVSFRVFPEPSPARRLMHIQASPTAWTIAQILFGLGATLTVVAIALLARAFDGDSARRLVQASTVLLLAALLPWIWHLYARAVDPGAFAAGSLRGWPLAIYFLLTPLGLAVYGVALHSSGLPAWVGWVVIASMATVVAVTLATRDMVPAIYYVVTLFTGVMLYR